MTLLTRRLFVVLAMLLAALASPAAANENVTRVNTSVLPPLAAGSSVPTLLVLDGRPVVVQGRTAAVRSGGAQAWTPINPGALSNLALRDVAGDGMRAVVTSTDGRLFLASRAERGIDVRPLGTLPQGVGAAKAALIEDEVVVIAQSPDGRSNLLRLPLSGEAQAWTRIAAPGGTPVALAGQSSILFVVVDRGGAQQVYSWTAKTGWKARTAAPQPLTGVVRSIGQAGLLFVAQVQGGRTLLTYNTITDAWSRVTTAIANEAVVAPFGDGVLTVERRGDQLVTTNNQLEYQRRALGWIDWTIISVYLVGMLGIGFYFWKRSRGGSTNEFFLGSRQIPFWAAGVSMFATNTSSISYLAVPAKAFDTDWQYMMSKVVTVFALIAVAILIIPMFRRLNLVSVFGYLETRFHPAIRMLSSALAILMHVGGRMGIVLFLPALAIGTITGTNVIFCILVIGVCTIVYTALGGMKAVVWTDFFQVVVLFGGAIFAIGFIVHTVGFGQIYDTAMQFDKTKMVNVSFDFTTPTLWGFIILYTFDTVLTFPKDQVLMQRVLSTSDEKEASRSVWLFALILMPAGFIFYIIGTTLFAYYRANPERLDPLLSDRRGVPGLYRDRASAWGNRDHHRRAFRGGDGDIVRNHQLGRDPPVGRLLRKNATHTADAETGGSLCRMDDGGDRSDRHRAGGNPVAARRALAARSDNRALRPARRKLRRGLYAGHVHQARQLAGDGDRDHLGHRGDIGVLGLQPGAPLFLPGDRDRRVDCHRLCREPVLPGADQGAARRPDHLRPAP